MRGYERGVIEVNEGSVVVGESLGHGPWFWRSSGKCPKVGSPRSVDEFVAVHGIAGSRFRCIDCVELRWHYRPQ